MSHINKTNIVKPVIIIATNLAELLELFELTGSATIGLKNADYAILLALKRAASELSAHQKKIIPIDRHVGVSLAGTQFNMFSSLNIFLSINLLFFLLDFSSFTHLYICIIGLTADARVLSKYLRNECLNNRFSQECALPVSRLVTRMGNKVQVNTENA